MDITAKCWNATSWEDSDNFFKVLVHTDAAPSPPNPQSSEQKITFYFS